jgi:hypothetical protein
LQRVVVTIMCGAQGARCHAGGDGDRADALEMEINGAKEEKAIPCHIILACDVNPFYASYFA